MMPTGTLSDFIISGSIVMLLVVGMMVFIYRQAVLYGRVTDRPLSRWRLYLRMLAEDRATLRAVLRIMVARWRAVRRLRARAHRGGDTDAS